MTRVKTYFHTPILAIWQMKNDKDRKNFILISFHIGVDSFPCQNAFEKCATKTKLCDDKNYIKKLYTRLYLQMLSLLPV